MEYARYCKFLRAVTPTLERLAKEWFPPDKKTPDGKSFYACTYCDQNFGKHDKHDDDCYAERAKQILAELAVIDKDPKYTRSPITGKKRSQKEVRELRLWNKSRVVLNQFCGRYLYGLIPMDYKAPDNKQVICTCRLFDSRARTHRKDCLHLVFAKALTDLMKVW